MKWNIAAPFFEGSANDHWIDDFVDDPQFQFRKVGFGAKQSQWHRRAQRATPLPNWYGFWEQASRALHDADGVVTVFPQLAAMVGLQKRLRRRRLPFVAWCFNVGLLPQNLKRRAAGAALASAQRIIVHSTGEVRVISDYLGLPPGVVQFVPLQCAALPVVEAQDVATPFVVAMGSANRDYATLVEAARRTKLPVKIVAASRLVEHLPVPDNVEVYSNLSGEECLKLAQRALFSIVPLEDVEVASGQVTVVEAMRMGRAVIATDSMGTSDYIDSGRTGMLVPPKDVDALAGAMAMLWDDAARRTALVAAATGFADDHLSDPAVARSLTRILHEAAAAA